MNLSFTRIVDLKCLMCDRGYWLSSLQTMADSFHVRHKGYKHRAASDSLASSETYYHFLEMHYKGILKPKLLNLVFGSNHLIFFKFVLFFFKCQLHWSNFNNALLALHLFSLYKELVNLTSHPFCMTPDDHVQRPFMFCNIYSQPTLIISNMISNRLVNTAGH